MPLSTTLIFEFGIVPTEYYLFCSKRLLNCLTFQSFDWERIRMMKVIPIF